VRVSEIVLGDRSCSPKDIYKLFLKLYRIISQIYRIIPQIYRIIPQISVLGCG